MEDFEQPSESDPGLNSETAPAPGPPVKRDGKGRFQKGVSPNPGGRKKGVASFDAALRRVVTRADAEKLARTLLKAGFQGDVTAAKFVWERLDGKATPEGVFVGVFSGESGVHLYLPQKQDPPTEVVDVPAIAIPERTGSK